MILGRSIVCHIAAFCFSTFVLAPAILTLWDRSLPFEYADMSFEVAAAFPGQAVQLRVVTGNTTALIDGEFDRFFYDGAGHPQYLGTFPAVYSKLASISKSNVWYKEFTIPKNAAPGDAIYVIQSKFWHNPVQGWIWPIAAAPQKAKIRVLPLPIYEGRDEPNDAIKQSR